MQWYVICKSESMKNKLSILVLVAGILFSVNELQAQTRPVKANPFRKGSVTVNLGVGFGSYYSDDFRSSSSIGTKAALEFGIWKAGPGVISLGPQAGVTLANKTNNRNRDDFRSQAIIIAGRSAWHYGWNVAGLDTYAGASAGIRHYHYSYKNGNDFSDDELSPVLGAFAGVSYFFTERFGVNAEAGFDITSLQAGVIFKLK